MQLYQFLYVAENDFTSYTKHWESCAQTGQMIGWGRGSAQNASRFSAMASDSDSRGRDLVDMRVR